jgi:Uma2 family endonuclease
MATAAPAKRLMTAEEFGGLPDDGRLTELVRGEIVEVNMPYPRHGQICSRISRIVGNYADEHKLGHVLTNDSGVVTEHDPDTVRGSDVAFYSFARVPPGPLPRNRYLEVVPELVFEVRSPGDRWSAIHVKIGEYRQAGVSVVCVADDPTERVHIFDDDGNRIFAGDDELTFPSILPDFRVAVRRFFE